MYYKKVWFKALYIFLTTILFILVGILLHWLLEYPVLYFLTKDFNSYSLGMSLSGWLGLHNIFSLLILLVAIFAGIYFGLDWYDKIYLAKMKKLDLLKHKNFFISAVILFFILLVAVITAFV